MDATQEFETAVALVLKLSAADRLRLVEQVVASVEREITTPRTDEHWGQQLLALLDSLDFGEWPDIEGDDPVEWVQQMRRHQATRRDLDWGAAE